jgi:hypothetical protein
MTPLDVFVHFQICYEGQIKHRRKKRKEDNLTEEQGKEVLYVR